MTEPRSRLSTPRSTSLEAWRTINDSGVLGAARTRVYNLLYERGPLTGDELSATGPYSSTGSTLRKRLSELERMGLVKRVGIDVNERTNRPQALWDVTDRLPTGKYRKLAKADEMFEALRKVKAELRMAHARIAQLERGIVDPRQEKLFA